MTLKATPTEVRICNIALLSMGRAVIADFDGETKEALLCEALYPFARDSLLEQAPWDFALKRVKDVPALGTPPEWGWKFAHQKPADSIKVWELEGEEHNLWRAEGDQIVANVSPINLLYTRKVEDSTQFSPTFIIAFAKWLESMMVVQLTGKTVRRTESFREAQFWIGEAMSMNGQQGSPNVPVASDLEEVRL